MSSPEQTSKPNPGSREAIDAGCRCPVFDNGCGRGYRGGPGFLYSAKCELHKAEFESVIEIDTRRSNVLHLPVPTAAEMAALHHPKKTNE